MVGQRNNAILAAGISQWSRPTKMITRPFELASRLSPPPRDFDFMAWVNVGVLALFFGLLGSRFVLAPGLPIGVGAAGTFNLPSIGAAGQNSAATSVVVSYRSNNVILFEGGMYGLSDLRKPLELYAQKYPNAVMLVRADRQVSVQDFFSLCDMARAAGFAGVQAAAETQASARPLP